MRNGLSDSPVAHLRLTPLTLERQERMFDHGSDARQAAVTRPGQASSHAAQCNPRFCPARGTWIATANALPEAKYRSNPHSRVITAPPLPDHIASGSLRANSVKRELRLDAKTADILSSEADDDDEGADKGDNSALAGSTSPKIISEGRRSTEGRGQHD